MNLSAIIEFTRQNTLYLIIAAAVVIITASGLIIFCFLKRKALIKALTSFVNDLIPDTASFKKRFSDNYLYRHSKVVELFQPDEKTGIIQLAEFDRIWITWFRFRQRKKDFDRILRYAPEKGLFDCFLTALKKKKAAEKLILWIDEYKDSLPLRSLGYSAGGKKFDGSAGYELLKEHMDQIRELTGDPEWTVRLFAVRILLHDKDDRSARSLRDAFNDAHHSVRQITAAEYEESNPDLRDDLYKSLYSLSLSDSVESVRKTAWARIKNDFADIHSADMKALSETQLLHLTGLLDKKSADDEALALPYLESKNMEIRFAAARYLEAAGALKRLLLSVSPGDKDVRKRVTRLLTNAAELKIVSFFNVLTDPGAFDTPAAREVLQVCGAILEKYGPPSAVALLCKKVFPLPVKTPEDRELYGIAVKAGCSRGNDLTLEEIKKELGRQSRDSEISSIILNALPVPVPDKFLSQLFDFFKDPSYKAVDSLKKVLHSAETSDVLRELFLILNEAPGSFSAQIRLRALKLLTELKLPYCLQIILENLYLLPPEDADDTAAILKEYPSDVLLSRLNEILQGNDSQLRAAVIRILPAAAPGKDFMKNVREAVTDADPDVRIAAVWAMIGYDDARSLGRASDMLRDPVERVRLAAALALGSYGSNDLLNKLADVLKDPDEVDPVRAAAVEGLGRSDSTLSVDILTERLETEEKLAADIIRALSGKNQKKLLSRLIENFKDAGPDLREKLVMVFKQMGEKGEAAIEELLREDIPSLKPLAAEILEAVGYVNKQIRVLAHRDPEKRRSAADFLSHAGTKSAFRGMVMAARDPDEEVRVMVIKALERLDSGEEKEILEALLSDPDKKVRTYTAWALERIKAKSLA